MTLQLGVYFTYLLFAVGFPGNIIVIVVLLSVRNYRSTPCTFYFLILAILNLIYLIIILITYILVANINISQSMISSISCKIQVLVMVTILFTTILLECLTIIDQFLVTSRSARRLVCISLFISILYGILAYISHDIIDSPMGKTCDIINSILGLFYAWFSYLISFSSLPISILLIFGLLTYRNMRILAIRRQQYQYNRQFIKIVSIQICLILISICPYAIYHVYDLITKYTVKNLKRLKIESFLSTFVNVMTYIKYTGIFYVFLTASKRFRHELRKLVCHSHRIQPMHVNVIANRINRAGSI